MTNFSVNPLIFKSMSLATQPDQAKFLLDLSLLLSQMTSAITAAGTVNGGSLTLTSKALGVVSSNQTVNCANAADVMVSFTTGSNITITLNNYQVGIPVCIKIATTAAVTVKIAASTPSGTAYTVTGVLSTGSTTNLTSSGVALGISLSFLLAGNSVSETGGPTLYLSIFG